VLRLAERQHGVVSRQQLLALGIGPEAVRHRWSTGRLVRVRRGVYALGHRALRPEGRWMAAVLACGPETVLSHRSAARLWGLRPWSGDVEVTITADRGRKLDGLNVRRAVLHDWERTLHDGLPVTTVARTLLDLAAVVPPHHLRRAVERAEQLELFDLRDVERVLAAHPRRSGRRALITLLDDARRHDLPATRSDLEAAFLQLCLDHDVPRPEVNRYKNDREVDFRWPDPRLIVEVDGYATHKTRRAFEDDRARDRRHLGDGWRTARFTWPEVTRRPRVVAAELQALLSTA
jgi:very-short-patch-repair endonuclease